MWQEDLSVDLKYMIFDFGGKMTNKIRIFYTYTHETLCVTIIQISCVYTGRINTDIFDWCFGLLQCHIYTLNLEPSV